jgi:hypothetical protein
MKKYILVLILTLVSCASRKVNVDITKEKKDSTVTTVSETKEIKTIDKVDSTKVVANVEEAEVEICPIDSTKEIIVNGKIYKNVRIKIKKNKSNTLYTNHNKTSQIQTKDSTGVTEIKDQEIKNNKAKAVIPIPSDAKYFWLILIIIALFILWQIKFQRRS